MKKQHKMLHKKRKLSILILDIHDIGNSKIYQRPLSTVEHIFVGRARSKHILLGSSIVETYRISVKLVGTYHFSVETVETKSEHLDSGNSIYLSIYCQLASCSSHIRKTLLFSFWSN